MIRTRFAPSPTGYIHCGNARAALFNALFAKKQQGVMVLRIEDTDQARSGENFALQLQSDLSWLGVEWQEGPGAGGSLGPYVQSARHSIYEKYYQLLEEKKLIYRCFCSDAELALNRKLQIARGEPPRYPGTCQRLTMDEMNARLAKGAKPAWRFRVPANKTIVFHDLVKGDQQFSGSDMGDFIIRRADGTAPFLFCNAIDDAEMKISHVLRGDDHLANTPRQLLLLEALSLPAPQYGHLSLITGDDGAPLSKRHGSFSLEELRAAGFLSAALMNYLARLGHSGVSNRLLNFAELATEFDTDKLGRASARFDLHQLLHWQKEAVRHLSLDEMKVWIGACVDLNSLAEKPRNSFLAIMRENIVFPDEAVSWFNIFFASSVNFDEKEKEILHQAGKAYFQEVLAALKEQGGDLKKVTDQVKNRLGVSGKKLFLPLRVALTGKCEGPDMAQIAVLLGLDEMCRRVEQASAC